MKGEEIMQEHPIASREAWLAARKALLAKEKQFTRARDALSQERRDLPWVKVDKTYVFETPGGKARLADLFAGRSQLILIHFMFGPEWEEGCVGCSFRADHYDGMIPHLNARDISLVVVSRAPLERLLAFKQRMGWRFDWVSSYGSDFNFDYNVSFTDADVEAGTMYYNYDTRRFQSDEMSGTSVFFHDGRNNIYHTYSSFARGGDMLIGAYNYIDLTPTGRNETKNGNLTDWVRHHDRYGAGGVVDMTGRYIPADQAEPCCGKDGTGGS
jgi:predicted dithiol-disulfide oxidoreductase (DUF899 family)